MTTYNGWTNYETWVVNLWLDNDGADFSEEATELVQEAIDDDESDPKDSAVSALAARIESMVDEFAPTLSGMFADLLGAALQAVNYREIAQHHIDDVTIYAAGWNMAGYSPDNTPALFAHAGSALDYVISEMEQRAEHLTDGTDGECLSDDTSHIPALIEELETRYRADANGEFGRTIGGTHYFVTKV